MTKDVYVTIKGLQFADDDSDIIEVINIGQFSEINHSVYIKYDEVIEGESMVSHNLIKISDDGVEITKKGPVTAHMSFVPNQKTMTYYETQFGNLYLGIFARTVEIEKTDSKITIEIEYSIEVNYEQISECNVSVVITPQNEQVKLI